MRGTKDFRTAFVTVDNCLTAKKKQALLAGRPVGREFVFEGNCLATLRFFSPLKVTLSMQQSYSRTPGDSGCFVNAQFGIVADRFAVAVVFLPSQCAVKRMTQLGQRPAKSFVNAAGMVGYRHRCVV